MDIIEKARELGMAIAGSKEMEAFKDAEAALEQDEKGRQLFDDYKTLQIELVKAMKAKKDQESVDEVKAMLLEKQRELNAYEITLNYMDAKNAFERLVKNVNEVITFCITGEEPCSPSKCGSCSGCK